MSLHIVHKQMALFFFPLFYLFLSRRCCSHGFCYCSLLIGTVTLHLQYLSIQLLRMEEISCSSVASDLTRKQSSVSRTKDVMGCHESPCNCFLGNMFFFILISCTLTTIKPRSPALNNNLDGWYSTWGRLQSIVF